MKKVWIFVVVILLILVTGGVSFFFLRDELDITTDQNKEGITRYQWIELLGEKFNYSDFENGDPVFADVDEDSPYFKYVQALVEWKVLESGKQFKGEEIATGKFVAITALKAVGESKLQIYLGSNRNLTNRDYLQIAIEMGLINEEQISHGISQEECQKILQDIEYFNVLGLWKDNYIDCSYKDKVYEITSNDIQKYLPRENSLYIDEKLRGKFHKGDVIVFPMNGSEFKNAGKVIEIDNDGRVTIEKPELEDVFQYFTVSDIVKISYNDIIASSQMEEAMTVMDTAWNSSLNATESAHDGFEVKLSSESGELKVTYIDNKTHESMERTITSIENEELEAEASIIISDIVLGAQVSYEDNEITYVNVECQSTVTNTVKWKGLSEEETINLFTAKVPLFGGIVGVDIDVNLVLSIDGTISVEVEIPMAANIQYEKGHGFRNIPVKKNYKEPVAIVEADLQLTLQIEPVVFVLFDIDVIDVEMNAGVFGEAVIQARPSMTCSDITITAPILSVGCLQDKERFTLLGALRYLNNGEGFEFEIVNKENAPFKKHTHYEITEQGAGYVDECTYEKQEEKNDNELQILSPSPSGTAMADEKESIVEGVSQNDLANYEGWIELIQLSPFQDVGDYYSITASVRGIYTIIWEDFEKISVGETFRVLDKHFVKQERISGQEMPGHENVRLANWNNQNRSYPLLCIENGETYYIIFDGVDEFEEYATSRFGRNYSEILECIDYGEGFYEYERLMTGLVEQEVLIPKDAYITLSFGYYDDSEFKNAMYQITKMEGTFEEKEKKRVEVLKKYAYTAGEFYEKDLELNLSSGWKIYPSSYEYDTGDGRREEDFGCRYGITYNEDGEIVSLIYEDFE